jgi:tetratricopeptide (TPR) repeat protein
MKQALAVLTIQCILSIPLALSQSNQIRSVKLDDSIAVSAVEAINRNELELADRIIAAQLAKDSTSLQWLFLRGMRNYAELFAVSSFNKDALTKMKEDMETVCQIGEKRLEKSPNDLYALFFTGGAYGYLGIAKVADGSVFSGVGTAKKGFNMHEDLIELWPECYDAYLGPGMMNLLTSDIPWILKPILWLFGLSGSEEKAYNYLSTAYEKGKLVRLEAGTYLAQLFERRKEFKKSFEIYSQLIQEYPMRIGLRAESTSPLWAEKRYDDVLALTSSTMKMFESKRYSLTRADSAWMPSILINSSRAYKLKGDTTSAIIVLEDFILKEDYLAINKWRIHSSLADFYVLQKDTAKVIASYKAILASDAPDDTKKRVHDALEKIGSSK